MIEFLLHHQYLLFAKLFFFQLAGILSFVCILFFIYEIIPLFFGMKSTIQKNSYELFRFELTRAIFAITIGTLFFTLFTLAGFGRDKGFFDITQFSIFSQVIILYFCIELTVYLLHFAAHTCRIPILSLAHGFHHTITTELQWVNSRKEHLFVISLFVLIFSIFFCIIFQTSRIVYPVVTATFLLLNSFSHFGIPFSIKLLDRIFLFPQDHLRHHTKRGGPYGVTLSLFDTILNTRDEYALKPIPNRAIKF